MIDLCKKERDTIFKEILNGTISDIEEIDDAGFCAYKIDFEVLEGFLRFLESIE